MRLPSFKPFFYSGLMRNLGNVLTQKNTMETTFKDLVDDFGNKINLGVDLEKELKILYHIENVSLKTKHT